jgi:hypothetical protein
VISAHLWGLIHFKASVSVVQGRSRFIEDSEDVVINIYAGRPRRVGMAREGASCSPDYVPAPAIDRCAEA